MVTQGKREPEARELHKIENRLESQVIVPPISLYFARDCLRLDTLFFCQFHYSLAWRNFQFHTGSWVAMNFLDYALNLNQKLYNKFPLTEQYLLKFYVLTLRKHFSRRFCLNYDGLILITADSPALAYQNHNFFLKNHTNGPGRFFASPLKPHEPRLCNLHCSQHYPLS